MEDELSQLDELIESDILDALGEESVVLDDIDTESVEKDDTEADDIVIEDFVENEPEAEDENLLEKEWESELNIEEDKVIAPAAVNMNTTDLASLLGQLLNNKTIEITIKIKD